MIEQEYFREDGPFPPDFSAWIISDGTVGMELQSRGLAQALGVEDVVADLGGSFSAEHGIGLYKLPTMRRRKTAEVLDAMRSVKRALDPLNLMNPGKLVPPANS